MQSDETDLLGRLSHRRPLSRREFMQMLTLAGAAGAGLSCSSLRGVKMTSAQRQEVAAHITKDAGKLPLRPFGSRLGNMAVTPVCISQDWNADVLESGLALGINYIHKAGYWDNLPPPLQKLPRESYYTDITVDSTPENPDDYDKAYNQVTSSLQGNGLKYYDIMRAHYGWKSPEILKTQTGTYRAFVDLKKKGLVKHFGCSQHNYRPYPEIIQAEIDCGYIDAIQLFYTYGASKEDEEIMAKASKAGIGMTAMKIYSYGSSRMSGDAARMAALKAEGKPGRALLRHVMGVKRDDGQPVFATCVSAIGSVQTFEENVVGLTQTAMLRDGLDGRRFYA